MCQMTQREKRLVTGSVEPVDIRCFSHSSWCRRCVREKGESVGSEDGEWLECEVLWLSPPGDGILGTTGSWCRLEQLRHCSILCLGVGLARESENHNRLLDSPPLPCAQCKPDLAGVWHLMLRYSITSFIWSVILTNERQLETMSFSRLKGYWSQKMAASHPGLLSQISFFIIVRAWKWQDPVVTFTYCCIRLD